MQSPAPILFVHDGQNWIRGSERCMLDLVRCIDRRRFRPVVLCNAPVVAEAARTAGATAYVTDGWRELGERLLPPASKVIAVREVLEAEHIALVHCNSASPLKALLPGVRARRIPLLAHLHIIDPLEDRLYSGLHQTTLAVGVSEAAVAGLRADGMAENRIRVIYNGVDPARMDRGDASGIRAELGVSQRATVLVAIGSLIPRKGIDVLIDAMAILRNEHCDVHLIVVGEGSARAVLEQQAARLALQSAVHFLGEREDAGAILRDAADIALSAARQEAFPLNVLEAAYAGLPMIASDIAPHRESVVNGQTGLLVSPDSPEEFARAVRSLVASPMRARALGANGASRVRHRYMLEHYVSAFERTYLELLSRPARTNAWFAASAWPRAYSRWVAGAAWRRLMRVASNSATAPGRYRPGRACELARGMP